MDFVFAALALIAYLLSVRTAYYLMITRNWLEMEHFVKASPDYPSYHNCPKYMNSSHPSAGRCRTCGIYEDDHEATRARRLAFSFAGPLLCLAYIPIAAQATGRGVIRAIEWKQPDAR